MSRRTRLCRPIHPNTVAIGVDVAKRSFVARSLGSDGRSGKRCRVACDAAGFEELLAYCRREVERYGGRGFLVALEPTGHYGEPLVAWLKARGVEVHAVQALFTARSKELFDGTWRKTDDKDALVIADLCRRGLSRPWRVLVGPFRDLRVLSRQREQLVKRRSRALNRIQRHVDVVFPELRELFVKPLSRTSRWVLREVPTPAAVLEMGEEQLAERLYEVSRWQLGRERARAMLEAAEASVGVSDGADAHRFALEQLLDEVDVLMAQLRGVELRMAQALKQVPYSKHLLSVPGLGVVLTATLLGELGDLREYRVAKQVLKMAGLDLVERSSGERQGHRQISRRGRRYARQMLYMAALKLGQGALRARRDRLVQRGKPATKAVVANMCALLRILFALARDGVDFDASRHASVIEKVA